MSGARSAGKDRELVAFAARHAAVTMEQVMAFGGSGRTASYRRVAACVEMGLLERVGLLRSEPNVLRATRAGLGLPVASLSPAHLVHDLRCVDVAIRAGDHYGHDRILTEREFALREQIEGGPLASVELGPTRRSDWPRRHRADLAILSDEGLIAIEVELTAKAPSRLEGLIRAWRRALAAKVVKEVHYLCALGITRRAVERAVEKVRAENRIQIADLPAEISGRGEQISNV